jgi:hypothetical protein
MVLPLGTTRWRNGALAATISIPSRKGLFRAKPGNSQKSGASSRGEQLNNMVDYDGIQIGNTLKTFKFSTLRILRAIYGNSIIFSSDRCSALQY